MSDSVDVHFGESVVDSLGGQSRGPDHNAVVAQAIPGVRHKVLDILSLGEFSSVYQCRTDAYGEVAVKVFTIGVRIRPEFKDIKELKHPNVLRIFKICEGERVGIVMELCGETLQTILHESMCRAVPAVQDPVQRLKAAADVFAAVAHLHSCGIMHRNVGAHNCYVALGACMLSPTKLGDFMRARSVPASQMTTWTGTASYMAPEVASDNSYSSPADVYSSGILVHEIVCRERPYGGSSKVTLLQHVVNGLRPDCHAVPQLGSAGGREELIALLPRWWHGEPERRPLAREAVGQLQHVIRLASSSGADGDSRNGGDRATGASAEGGLTPQRTRWWPNFKFLNGSCND